MIGSKKIEPNQLEMSVERKNAFFVYSPMYSWFLRGISLDLAHRPLCGGPLAYYRWTADSAYDLGSRVVVGARFYKIVNLIKRFGQ